MKTVTFVITDLICCGDQQTLEQRLKLNPHIIDTSVNFVVQTATISYYTVMLKRAEKDLLIV